MKADFWKVCCESLKTDPRLGSSAHSDKFATWIAPLQPTSWDPDNHTLVIAATSSHKKEATRDNYGDLIQQHAQKVNNGHPVNIVWTVRERSTTSSTAESP